MEDLEKGVRTPMATTFSLTPRGHSYGTQWGLREPPLEAGAAADASRDATLPARSALPRRRPAAHGPMRAPDLLVMFRSKSMPQTAATELYAGVTMISTVSTTEKLGRLRPHERAAFRLRRLCAQAHHCAPNVAAAGHEEKGVTRAAAALPRPDDVGRLLANAPPGPQREKALRKSGDERSPLSSEQKRTRESGR